MSKLAALLENRLKLSSRSALFTEGAWRTERELLLQVERIQAQLSEAGVRPGDHILLMMGNSYAFIAAYVSLLLLGATVVPVNPAMPLPELKGVIVRAQPTGAILRQTNLHDFLVACGEETTLSFALGLDPALKAPADLRWIETTMKDACVPHEANSKCIDESAGAVLLFTSGTTGIPKGVLLTHEQILATAKQVAVSHHLTSDDVCYLFLPLFHINAQVIGLLASFITGGRIVLEERFSASKFWSTVSEHQVTWISAVPAVLAILLRSPQNIQSSHRLRFIRSASAPLPPLHAKRFEARFGVAVVESYGLTEAASQVCVNPIPPGRRKLGSVGLPCGVELSIVDESGETHRHFGEVGEVAIRGASVITSYAFGESDAFRGGWFHTGDLGYLDEDGYLFIVGRLKEIINRAGQKISPREVEEVIGQDPDVENVAVIGVPDPVYGERVVAYVVKDASRNVPVVVLQDRIRSLCTRSLSAYKCPSEIRFIDTLPQGPTGKIQRQRVSDLAMAVGEAISGGNE